MSPPVAFHHHCSLLLWFNCFTLCFICIIYYYALCIIYYALYIILLLYYYILYILYYYIIMHYILYYMHYILCIIYYICLYASTNSTNTCNLNWRQSFKIKNKINNPYSPYCLPWVSTKLIWLIIPTNKRQFHICEILLLPWHPMTSTLMLGWRFHWTMWNLMNFAKTASSK